MRVCLVTPYDLSHEGGVNRHVVTLARALGHLGHDVNILGPATRAAPPRCDTLPGVVVLPANGSRARIGLFVSRRSVRQYLHDGRFDVVHVHEPWVPGPARCAVQAADAPIVATFHAFAESESRLALTTRRLLARPLRRIRAAIAVSTVAAEFAQRAFRGPICIVPNGIDGSRFETARTRFGAPSRPGGPGPLRLLFVGRFDEPRKGLRHFLEAAALIAARGRPVEIRIVGSGDPRPYSELAVRTEARFLGWLDDAELARTYGWCDVFCAPSTHGESFGLVLVEAMASGRPVVASDIPGYRDAAAGAAILVPPGDHGALADALLAAADDGLLRLRLVTRGRLRARQLTWSRLVVHVTTLYAEVARQSRRAIVSERA